MDDSLPAMLTGHLGVLEKIFNWAFFVVLAVFWAALKGGSEVEVAKIKVQRRDAFWAVGVTYVSVGFQIWSVLSRIRLLVTQDEVSMRALHNGVLALQTHTWLLNPFGYFGSIGVATRIGFFLLVLIWWLSIASLITLANTLRPPRSRPFLRPGITWGAQAIIISLVVFLGMCSYYEIFCTYYPRDGLSNRLAQLHRNLFAPTADIWRFWANCGAAVGFAVCAVVVAKKLKYGSQVHELEPPHELLANTPLSVTDAAHEVSNDC